MIAAALSVLVLAALPEGSARYRAELGGERVGVAELRIACDGPSCSAAYDARLRLPAEAGGEVRHARVEVEVDREGRWRGGPLSAARDGVRSAAAGVEGAVAASVVEVVLAATAPARGSACVPFFDEQDAVEGKACAKRAGRRVVADVGGVAEVIVPGTGGFPAEIVVGGRFRFVRDAGAKVPARAPRLAGTRVPGPAAPAEAVRFCAAPLDPRAGAEEERASARFPPPRAPGESCREKTASYLAAARRRGIEGRTAVGVAWDGGAFVWHAWAELRSGDAWIAVDPSFEQLPARGPRFTLARYRDDDARARSDAGARLLACWGGARVEPRSR